MRVINAERGSNEMISPSDVLIFDLDGTLVQSAEFDDAFYQESVSEVLGHSRYSTDWERYTHVTDTGLLFELLTRLGIDASRQQPVIDQVRESFCDKVATYLNSGAHCTATPGALDMLQGLKSAGIKFGIATGGWGKTARMKLRHAGIEEPDALSSCDDAVARADIMQHCLQRLGAQREGAVYFGDGPWDAKATAALGWKFVGVGGRLAGKCDVWISDFVDPAWIAAQQRIVERGRACVDD